MEQTDKPVVRIPYKHLIFVTEVIRHGDKEKAYNKAYPGVQPKSRKPAACRLYNRPEIKQLIDEGRAEVAEKAYEKAKQDGIEVMSGEYLTLHEKRSLLARIARGEQRMNRYYKFKDRVETKEVAVDNPNVMISATKLDDKLIAGLKIPPETPETTTGEYLTLHEKRCLLSRIACGKQRMKRYYKFKDHVEVMEVPVDNPNVLIRAADLDGKLGTASPEKLDPDNLPEGYVAITCTYNGKDALSDGRDDLTDEEYDHLIKLSLTDPDIRVVPPRLTPMQENAGCWIERDPETGKYEVLCPAENIGMLKWPPDLDADTKKVTSVNNNTSQNTGNQPKKRNE